MKAPSKKKGSPGFPEGPTHVCGGTHKASVFRMVLQSQESLEGTKRKGKGFLEQEEEAFSLSILRQKSSIFPV